MPWDDLTKPQKTFIKTYFTSGKGLSKIGKKRNLQENKDLIEGYRGYLQAEQAVLSALRGLEGSPEHKFFNDEYLNAKRMSEANGTFVGGTKDFQNIARRALRQGVANARKEKEGGEKAKLADGYYRKLQAAVSEDEPALKELEAKVEGLALLDTESGLQVPDTPFAQAHADLTAQYYNVIRKAVENTKLPIEDAKQAMETAVSEYMTKRKAVMAKAEAALKDTAALEVLAEAMRKAPEFRQLMQECQVIADDLIDWEVEKAGAFQKALRDIGTKAEKSRRYDLELVTLGKWKVQAEKARTDAEAAFDTAAKKHQIKIAALTTGLSGLSSKVPAKQKEQLADLIAMANLVLSEGKNIGALAPLGGMLDKADTLLVELSHAETINQKTAELISQISEVIGKPGGTDMLPAFELQPTRYNELKTAFNELHEDWQDMPPEAAQMAFDALAKQVAAFKTTTDGMRTWRDGMLTKYKAVEKKVNALAKAIFDYGKEDHGTVATMLRKAFGVTGDKYEGALRETLSEAHEMITGEDPAQQNYAETKLNDVETKADSWLNATARLRAAEKAGTAPDPADMGVVAELLTDQQAAVDAREEKERRIKDFEARTKQTAGNLKKLKGSDQITDKTREEYEAIEKLNESALSQAKAGNLDAAEELRSRVQIRITRAMSAPPKATDNFEKLADIGKSWAGAVSRLGEDLSTLARTASDAVEEDTAFDKDKTAQAKSGLAAMQKVADAFDAAAFDAAASVLGDPDTAGDEKARKQAREDALRLVRLYRGYMKGNELVRHAAMNPFKVSSIAVPLNAILNYIELEVLRGV
ncbi:hypothetical protein [Leisingera sp. S232]|uniref:hypothetical protein n=1 Tax=Leisingera sp. S232 TaxID=3415132 RepID=UPI003C7D1F3E